MSPARQFISISATVTGLLAAAACVRCTGDAGQGTDGVAGASGGLSDAWAEGSAIDAPVDSGETGWIPLEPLGEGGEYFPLAPPAPQMDCYPACRAIIPIPLDHPGYYTYSFDQHQVVDGDRKSLYLADLDTGQTRLVARASGDGEGIVQPHIHGRYLSYQRGTYPRGQVEIVDLIDKRKRVVHAYESSGMSGTVVQTAVNNTHAFWITTGALWSADLETGEKRKLTWRIIGCDRHCTADNAFLCATTTEILSVHPVTGEVTTLAPTTALQTDGICSPDKTQFTWVDYRDPPGPASTWDGFRTGGEVYVLNLTSNELKRITFDSPVYPKAKAFPAVDRNQLVWLQPPAGAEQNPDYAQGVYAAATVLWRYHAYDGRHCWTDKIGVGKPFLIDGRLYSDHLSQNQRWLIEFDLDHPSIPWTCAGADAGTQP